MIKLIATDMDGTLLDDNKNLPADFDYCIGKLEQMNINFTISSGRSYSALEHLFGEKSKNMSFICDNGAYVMNKGKLISHSIMSDKMVKDIIKLGKKENLLLLLCGMHGTYHNSSSEYQHKEIGQYYINQIHLDDLDNCHDDIFKIAIFDQRGIEENGYRVLKSALVDNANIQISGKFCVDVMNPDISKGSAIKTLQNNIGASYEETMAFGDFLNDIEMLESAYYSFAMENAHKLVKAVSNFSTGTNNQDSVTKEIRRLVFHENIIE